MHIPLFVSCKIRTQFFSKAGTFKIVGNLFGSSENLNKAKKVEIL